MAYITVADLRQVLFTSSQPAPTIDDALLARYIGEAQALIEGPAGAGRVFEAAASTTRAFDSPITPWTNYQWNDLRGPLYLLQFDRYDICQIDSVVNGDGVTVTPSQYVTLPKNETPYYGIKLKLNSGVVWTYTSDYEACIAVTGRWAYSVTAPLDIQHITARLAAFYYRQKDTSNDVGQVTFSSDGIAILPTALAKDVLEVCLKYRRLV